jgi:hypothetical protein
LTKLAGRRLGTDDNCQSFDDWDGTCKHSYLEEDLDNDYDMYEDEDDDDVQNFVDEIGMPVVMIRTIFEQQFKTSKLRDIMMKKLVNYKPFDMIKPEEMAKLFNEAIDANRANLSVSEVMDLFQFITKNFCGK